MSIVVTKLPYPRPSPCTADRLRHRHQEKGLVIDVVMLYRKEGKCSPVDIMRPDARLKTQYQSSRRC